MLCSESDSGFSAFSAESWPAARRSTQTGQKPESPVVENFVPHAEQVRISRCDNSAALPPPGSVDSGFTTGSSPRLRSELRKVDEFQSLHQRNLKRCGRSPPG